MSTYSIVGRPQKIRSHLSLGLSSACLSMSPEEVWYET